MGIPFAGGKRLHIAETPQAGTPRQSVALRTRKQHIRNRCAAMLARKERSDGIAIVRRRRDRVTTVNAALLQLPLYTAKGTPLWVSLLLVGRGYILPKPRKRGPLGKASHCGRANNTPVTAAPQCSHELPRTRYFCLLPLPVTQKALTEVSAFCVVGRGRFELPKSETSDLQSDPFGHSGIFPYLVVALRRADGWSW